MGSFRLDPVGVGELLRSEEMVAAMVAKAEKVRDLAELTAPYDAEAEDPEHFKNSFHVTSRNDGGYEHDRAEATVYSDDPAGFWIEVGTSRTPAHHTLIRALDAAGD